METDIPPAFRRLGPANITSPVILSVPHAGRYYDPSVIADAAVPLARLRLLEDRYADLLITSAVEHGATALVAEHARAAIDLNRDPGEIDPAMLTGTPPAGLMSTMRTRHGLGLIPNRMGDGLKLWRRRFTIEEVNVRIERFHIPYHKALGEALAAAYARFGVALLIDCHSMPSIRADHDSAPPTVIIGDRFGHSAPATISDFAESIARQAGFLVGRNTPYAGGFSLDRHGRPHLGIHAIQIEIDRNQYLDERLDRPGKGLERARTFIARLFDSLDTELRMPPALAAE